MSDSDLATIALAADRLPEAASWADGFVVRLPASLAEIIAASPNSFCDASAREQARNAARELRLRAAFTPDPPASSRLPISYHSVPGPARQLIARLIGRAQRSRDASWGRFPGWPIDLSADFAADLAGEPGITYGRTPVLLSHDIDSPEGLRNLAEMFLPLEEAIGARSANYIVPCAWEVDHGLLSEVKHRGHEIGVHGYDHANRTPFCNAEERRRRLQAGRAFADRYGAIGYRAPSLLRTEALLADLGSFYRYDSSIPTSGGAFPVPNNGCASARPWRMGQLWEIPLTLPRDGSLRFLGYPAAEITQLWRKTAEMIARSGGVVSLLTHCERRFSGNELMLDAYRSFLEWISGDSRFEFMRMDELTARLEA